MKLGSEVNYLYPGDSWRVFLVHAWILDKKPEMLESWLDMPWVGVGNLYYVEKLCETVRSYRRMRWVSR